MAFVLLFSAVSHETAMGQAPKKLTIALPMIQGFEKTKLVDILHELSGVLSKKLGIEVKSGNILFKHNQQIIDLVRERMKEGEADLSYIDGIEHGEMLLEGKSDLIPLAVLAMQKTPIEKTCFFTRKGEFSDVSELRGKKWKGPNTVMPRYLLFKKGIDEKPDAFFGSTAFETDTPIMPLLDQLKNKQIDVFSTYMHTVWLSGELNKKDPVIQPLYCVSNESHWVFVARKGLPEDLIKQIKEILLNAHKDKDFASFQFAFKMVDGRFVPVDDKIAQVNREYAALVKKQGWKKEDAEFFKKNPPVYKYKVE